ncbi:MAG: AAA family ATPase [Nanoarchaeota archaeon]
MKLKKIVLENIRSYKNQEVELPEGSILLSGDIGSGKTSVLLGIEFALFGLQPGQKGSSLLRNGENNGKVILEFEIDDKNILIERTLKRGKSISQEDCSITIDGEKKEISVMELKSCVLELLNYPKEFSKKQNLLYKFTVYTPQEEMKEIILQDSETRVNTLRHIFGIDKYKKILENVSILASKIREEKRIKENLVLDIEQDKLDLVSKENELESRHYNLASVEKEFFLKTEERKKIQEEKDSIREKINEKSRILQEIEKIKIMISNKEDFISGNKKTIKQLSLQVKESEYLKFDETEILKFEEDLKLKKRQKIDLNDLFIKISSEINSLSAKNQENAEIKTRISSVEVCPTCLQEVNVLYKNNILAKINLSIFENLKKIEVLNSEKRNAQIRLSEIDMQFSFIEKKIQDYNIIKIKFQNINEKKSMIAELEENNLIIQKEIKNLQVKIFSQEKLLEELGKFDSLYEEKQKAFDLTLRQERLAEIKTAELRKEIEFFSKQIGELKEKIKKTAEIKKQLNYLVEIESWISKKFVFLISMIERNVMTKLKKEFSELFAEWFSMLVSESFNVKLDDNFTPVIEQQDYELDYSYLSGGERTAIALAYRLALNQVINSLLSKIKTKDIVVLDEPTDGFSAQQLDKLRDVLAQLNVKQLIIVSHEQKIESFVENVIRFKKVNGMSVRES